MDFLSLFFDAVAFVDSAAHRFEEGGRFPLCDPEALEGLFRAGGPGGTITLTARARAVRGIVT